MKLERNQLEKLLEALHDLDVKAAPHGLYAIREHQAKEGELHPEFKMEWDLALAPALKGLKCNPPKFTKAPPVNVFVFQKTAPISTLALVRLSKIKVRKYGNAYRVDPHHDFTTRWNDAGMEALLTAAMEWSKRLVLFIGFSDEAEPFAKEFAELEETKTFRENMAEPIRRAWDDPHERGFKVMVSLWYAKG
jgi:hypothetical protein